MSKRCATCGHTEEEHGYGRDGVFPDIFPPKVAKALADAQKCSGDPLWDDDIFATTANCRLDEIIVRARVNSQQVSRILLRHYSGYLQRWKARADKSAVLRKLRQRGLSQSGSWSSAQAERIAEGVVDAYLHQTFVCGCMAFRPTVNLSSKGKGVVSNA